MADKETQMPAQSKGTPKAEAAADAQSTVDVSTVEAAAVPPTEDAAAHRQAWADANGVDPSEMREIHYPGGWVDRFDGRGWVREG